MCRPFARFALLLGLILACAQGADHTPPSTPTNVHVTATTDTSLALAWTASTDNVGVTGYNIYQGSTPVLVGTSTTTSFTYSGLQPSTTYVITVKAKDAAGNLSTASTALNATTAADTTAPTTPGSFAGSALSDTSVKLTWTASTDDVAVTGYAIYNGAGTQIGTTAAGVLTFTNSGLVPNSQYSYTAKAFDAAGNHSAATATVSVTTLADTTAPSTPGTPTLTTTTMTSVTFGWTASTDDVGVTGYEIWRGNVYLASTSALSYQDSTCAPSTTYAYQVRAYDAAGNKSAFSATLSATTQPDTVAPTAPTNLTVTGVTASTVSLSWSASTDNISVMGYNVYRGATLVGSPTGTTFTDTGLAALTSYTYTVKAFDEATPPNLSAASSPVTATTTSNDATPPSVPANVSLQNRSDSFLMISWNGSVDNPGGSGVAAYDIYSNGTFVASATSVPYTITGLAPNTFCTITVKARDIAGNVSAASIPVTFATLTDQTAPTIPTGLTSPSKTTTSITLSWTAATDNVAVTGYDIWRGNTRIAAATGTTFTDTGLTPGATYSYSVAAYDAAGMRSSPTSAINVTTVADTTAPTAPSGLTSTARTDNSVSLSWTAGTDAVGVGGYRVMRNGQQSLTAIISGTTAVDTALVGNTTYTYTVRTVDLAGNPSVDSNQITVTTLADTLAPSTPQAPAVTATTMTTIALTWQPAGDDVGVVSYDVLRPDNSVVATVGGTGYTATGLIPATSYTFALRARDAAGNVSGVSGSVTATTTADTTPPSVPAIQTATATDNSVNVTFSGSNDINGSGVVGYTLYRDGVSAVTTTTTPVSLTGLVAAHTYVLTLTAHDAAGNESVPSVPFSITTLADATAPTAPTGLTSPAKTASSVSLTWTASTDNVAVTGYDILRSSVLVGSTSGTSYTDTGLTPSTSYSYSVRAFDAAGNRSSASTTTSVATSADSVAPTAPSGLAATGVTAATVSLSWTAGTDDVALAGYNVYRAVSPATPSTLVATLTGTGTTYTDSNSGLSANTGYSYFVKSRDLAGNLSAASNTVTATTAVDTVAPSVPGTPYAAATPSYTSIQVKWAPSTDNVGVASYDIVRTNPDTTTVTFSSPSNTYNDTGLTPATTYSYQIRARDAASPANVSALSGSAALTTLADTTPPTPPVNLTIGSRTDSAVSFSFSPGSDGSGSGVVLYEISNNGTVIGTTASTSYTASGLAPGTACSFTIRSKDAAGLFSAASLALVASTTTDNTVPSTPAAPTVGSATMTALTVTWAAATDNVGVIGYDVLRNSLRVATVTSGLTYTDTGLIPNTSYSYTICAVDAVGLRSSASPIGQGRTLTDTTAPSAPTLSNGTPTQNSVPLTWTASTDNTAVSGYNVYRGASLVATVTGTSYTDTPLTGSTSYTYTVKAVDLAGNLSAASNAVTAVTTADTVAPTVPGGPIATSIAYTSVSIQWSASSDNCAVTGYDLQRDPNTPNVQTFSTASTSFTDSNLVPGSTHTYAVRAKDAAANASAYTATISVTLKADTNPPPSPTNVTLQSKTTSSVSLSWTSQADGETAISGYDVSRNGVVVGSSTTTTFTDSSGISSTGSYTYTVTEKDSAQPPNVSPASAPLLVVISSSDTTAPSTPTGLGSSGVTVTSATISWTASTDNVGVAGYEIFRSGVRIGVSTTTSFTDTGLTPNSGYTYSVVAYDAGGNRSTASSGLSVTTTADTQAPTAATNLAQTGVTANSASLSWSPGTDNSGIKYYYLFRGATTIGPLTTTSYTDTGLQGGTAYTYKVREYDLASNASPDSTALVVTTSADTVAPATPSAPYVSGVSATTVTLAWLAVSDPGVVTYTVYRAIPPASATQIASGLSSTSYTDGSRTPGTSYTYTVQAIDQSGNGSAQSAALSVTTTVDATAPTMPNVTLSSRTDSSITLQLSGATDTGSGIVSYDLYQNGTFLRNILVGTTPVFSGLSVGTSYRFAFVARDAANNASPQTPDFTVSTTSDATAPTAPSAPIATPSATTVALSWSAASDNVGVSGYEILRGGIVVGTTTTLGFTDSGLTPGSALSYTVRAYDAAGLHSAQSGTTSTTTTADTTAPSIPGTPTAGSPTTNSIPLSWGASTDNVALAGYNIYFSTGVLAISLTGSATSYTVTGLSGSTPYTFYIKARDLVGNLSGQSANVSATTLADTVAPSTPGTPYATSTSFRSFTLAWAPSTDNVGVASYDVVRTNPDTTTTTLSSSTNSFTDSSLTPGATYSYQIRARDGATPANVSALSGAVTLTTQADTTPPSSPFNLTFWTRSDTSLAITWSGGSDGGSGVVSYTVTITAGGTTVATASTTTTSFTPNGLTPSTAYTFSVVSVDAAGNASLPSVPLTLMTSGDVTAPTTPAAPTVSAKTETSVSLAWTAATDNVGVVGYDIIRDGVRVGAATTLAFTDGGLLPNQSHNYSVRAYDAVGLRSASSASINVTTVADTTLPTAPGAPTVTGTTDHSVSLTWSAGSDNVGIASYQILRNHVVEETVPATSGTDTGSGIAANTSYTYTIRTVDLAGNVSVESAATTATTAIDSVAPATPQAPIVTTVATTTVGLAWTLVGDDVGVSGYDLLRDGTVVATGFTSGTATDSGLIPGTTHSWSVRARDAAGNVSGISPSVSATTLTDVTPPGPPINVTSTNRTDSSIDILWFAATDPNGPISFYEISSNGAVLATLAGTAATYSSKSLLPDHGYTFTVVAIDAGGNRSVPSVPLTVRTMGDLTNPGAAPGVVDTARTDSSVTLGWSPATDNVGVVGYDVMRNNIRVGIPTGLAFTDTGLAPGTSYTYTIYPYDAVGLRALPAVQWTVTTLADTTPPSAPGNLVVTGTTAGSVSLAWTASTDNGTVVGYPVYRDGALVGTASGTTYTDTGLLGSTTHQYYVQAKDGVGNLSAVSNTVSATTKADVTAPTSPSGLVATARVASVTLTWNASSDDVGVVAYDVKRNGTLVGSPTLPTFTDAGLQPSTAYSYAVTARDAAGNASGAATASATTTAVTSLAMVPDGAVALDPSQQLAFAATIRDSAGNTAPATTVTWTLTGAGTLTTGGLYTAPSSAGGPYTVKASGYGFSDTASVTVAGPVANSGTVTCAWGRATSFALSYTATGPGPLTFTVGTPTHGTLSGTPPNLTYTPSDPFFVGLDSFTWSLNDGIATSNIATATLNVKQAGSTPLMTEAAFNQTAYLANPTAYLAAMEPGTVWQTAAPGAGVSVLQAVGATYIPIASQAAVQLQVQAPVGSPVVFCSVGEGVFSNNLNTMAVQTDAQGHATVSFTPPDSGRTPVLVACPQASGQVRFIVKVGG